MMKVQLPTWFTDGVKEYGYTDGVTTYCCSSEKSWYVECEDGYSGYFRETDLHMVGE